MTEALRLHVEREHMLFAMLMEGEELNAGGFIRGPGKFEGSPAYALYYYDRVMNGFSDEIIDANDGTVIDRFNVGDVDVALFPELQGERYLDMWECDQGFVYVDLISL